MTPRQTDSITSQPQLKLHGSYCVIFARALRLRLTNPTSINSYNRKNSKMNCQRQIRRRKVHFYIKDKFKICNSELIATRV